MLKGLFSFYRWCVSPFLGENCRFYPSCSRYSEAVIAKRGFFVGLIYSMIRLGKCHPFHSGGVDLP